jgi:hypothetical protein
MHAQCWKIKIIKIEKYAEHNVFKYYNFGHVLVLKFLMPNLERIFNIWQSLSVLLSECVAKIQMRPTQMSIRRLIIWRCQRRPFSGRQRRQSLAWEITCEREGEREMNRQPAQPASQPLCSPVWAKEHHHFALTGKCISQSEAVRGYRPSRHAEKCPPGSKPPLWAVAKESLCRDCA